MSDTYNAILVISKLGPIKFDDLDAALASPATDPEEPAYEGFDHFVQSTKAGDVRRFADLVQLVLDDSLDLNSELAKRNVWHQLAHHAMSEQDALERRNRKPKKDAQVESHQTQPQPTKRGPKPAAVRNPKPGVRTGARVKWPDHWKIEVLIDYNPKKRAAAQRFDLYESGMTVAEYIEAGGTRADLNWDERNNWISITDPEKEDGGDSV